VWARGEGGRASQEEFGISNTINNIITYVQGAMKYIYFRPQFNLLFGLFFSELCLTGTHPSPDAIRYTVCILYSIEQNMSLTAGPPSSSLADEPYYMYITGLRHFRDIEHTFNNSLTSCSHAK
jgi:hypothetical protein